MIWTRAMLVVAMWALVLPHLAGFAQDEGGQEETAAQTVAQGVMAMPAETMVWQSELLRAVVAPRAEAIPQPGGFVVADTGALAVTDADGKVLQRLGPGEATWIEPGAIRAIASLESGGVGYLRISLIPAIFVPDEPGAASHSDPFPATPGMADLGLLRDVLETGEELNLASGDAPAWLQVTRGRVYLTDESGQISEVAEGSPFQFQGAVTLSGGSRAPAAFIIARVGPSVPARITLLDPNATPVATPLASPQATPLALDQGGSIAVEAWLCPPGYDESSPFLSCAGPAVGVRFTAETEGDRVSLVADEGGLVAYPSLTQGDVTIRATLPEGAATATATCQNLRGNDVGRVRGDAVSLSLPPNASVTCSWFIELGETWPAATFSATVLACPPGMTAEALHPEFCVPAGDGVELQLSIEGATLEPIQASEGVWVWGPLLERRYDLTLTDLSSGFSSAVLDDGTASEEGEPIHIDLGEDLAPARTVYLLPPPDANAAEIDSDADLLTDAQETDLGTDPFLIDSDADGLPDGDETGFYGTDPLLADTDDDSLNDQEEVAVYFTSPFLADTDGDGVDDGEEIAALTNPLDLLSLPPTPTPEPTATPSPTPPATPELSASPIALEAMPEVPAGTPVSNGQQVPAVLPTRLPEASPVAQATPVTGMPEAGSRVGAQALDNDGLTTLEEISIHGTDPLTADTDGDGLNDGEEVASGRDPLDAAN